MRIWNLFTSVGVINEVLKYCKLTCNIYLNPISLHNRINKVLTISFLTIVSFFQVFQRRNFGITKLLLRLQRDGIED